MENDGEREIFPDWNGYSFKVVGKSDIPKVLAMLRASFYVDEPIHKILGFTEERAADMDQKIGEILGLEHGSFYAVPEDKPDQIAAVLIIWIHRKDFELTPFEARSPLTALVRRTIVRLKIQYDIHERRGVTEYPELFIISTNPNHRGKGLATEMYRRAISKLKEGFPLVSSTFTNPLSRKIGEKLGFKPVARIDLKDIKNEDGSSVFGEDGDPLFAVETVLDLIKS